MTHELLSQKANSLPQTPGVYLMVDAEGTIIYVGKAKRLRNRVSSYFRGEHLPKVEAMVEKIDDFDTIFVSSELEALLLENALIKQYQPHYNILLKDDKGYPYIKVDTDSEYPDMKISAKQEDDGCLYFGPFGGRSLSAEIIRTVKQALLLPDCSRVFPRDIGKARPCLNYDIGKCLGWCLEDSSAEEYRKLIDEAVLILKGRSRELISELTDRMQQASDELRFEEAAELRDRINSIKSLSVKQKVVPLRPGEADEIESSVSSGIKYNKTLSMLRELLSLEDIPERIEAYDISNLGDTGIVAGMTVFKNGRPYKRDYRKFKIEDMPVRDDYASMEQTLRRRFTHYAEGDEKFSELPDLLLMDGGDTHAAVAERVLGEFGLDIPVYGMVKDSRHRTRALINSKGEEIGIKGNQALFSFIGTIQEETHRFAITYQRKTRKAVLLSALDSIEGIGPKRKAELIKRFGSLKNIKSAELTELENVLPKDAAASVYSHFNKEEGN